MGGQHGAPRHPRQSRAAAAGYKGAVAGHWIGGREVPGSGAGRFEARGASGALEAWPRACRSDLDGALEAAGGSGARAWLELPAGVRRRAVACAVGALARQPLGYGTETPLEARFDVWVRAQFVELARQLEAPPAFGALGPPEPARGARGTRGTPSAAVCLGHSAQGPVALVERVASALAAGWPVVLLADEHPPGPAAALARAAADLPPGALAVLHGGLALASEALATGVGAVFGAAPSASTRALRTAARAAGARWVDVEESAGRVEVLGAATEPASAAEGLLETAFGAATLGGQLAGGVVAARIAARVYGPLVDELLARVDRNPERLLLPPPLDPGAPAALAARIRRALDEGATLVVGDLPAGRGRAHFGPAILVNAELAPGVMAECSPLPVLLLARG